MYDTSRAGELEDCDFIRASWSLTMSSHGQSLGGVAMRNISREEELEDCDFISVFGSLTMLSHGQSLGGVRNV